MKHWLAQFCIACWLLSGAALTLAETPATTQPAAEATREPTGAAAALAVRSDFPNGSAEVQAIDQAARLIRIVPAQHPDRGWACWWHFKVSGIVPGETLTLDVGDGGWATPDRAFFSTDGKTWLQTEPGARVGQRIAYRQKIDGREAWFAWGAPFTAADAVELGQYVSQKLSPGTPRRANPALCMSLQRRSVPAIQLRPDPTEVDHPLGIVVVARQHAWEVGSSWVCSGLVEWLVSDDPRATALRPKARWIIVPVMDVDNVTIGAGGKEEKPFDHNRDWTDQPRFPAVAALQAKIKEWDAAGQFDLFVDLHNPAPSDLRSFFFVSPRSILSDVGATSVDRFLQTARLEMTGPLKFEGQSRESGPDYDTNWQRIGKNWVTKNTRPQTVAITLEVPWNTPASTVEGYKQVGRELGQAMERYFRKKKDGG